MITLDFFQTVHKATDICLVTNVFLQVQPIVTGYNPIVTVDMHVIHYSQDGRNREGGWGAILALLPISQNSRILKTLNSCNNRHI